MDEYFLPALHLTSGFSLNLYDPKNPFTNPHKIYACPQEREVQLSLIREALPQVDPSQHINYL